MNATASEAVLACEEALLILTRIAKASVKDIVDFKNVEVGVDQDGSPIKQGTWTFKNADDIPDDLASCIKSLSTTSNGLKIELYDSHSAIKQLSEMLGWNAPKKTELTGKNGQPVAVQADVNSVEIVEALNNLIEKL